MSVRKHITLQKSTYADLKKCRSYDREPLTKVLERLIEKYGGLI